MLIHVLKEEKENLTQRKGDQPLTGLHPRVERGTEKPSPVTAEKDIYKHMGKLRRTGL